MNVSSVSGTAATTRPSGPPPGSGPEKTMKAVAEELGMSTDDLVTTIAGTLPSTGPDGASIDPVQRATDIANGVRPERQQRGDEPQADLSQGLDSLSGALGISSSDLLDRLTSGTGIGDLLAGNPQVSAQPASLQSKGALVDGYA